MQYHTADELDSEVLHAETSPCAFTAYGKSFRQDVVKRLPFSKSAFELIRLGSELIICQRLHLFIIRLDAVDDLFDFLYFFCVKISEDLFH